MRPLSLEWGRCIIMLGNNHSVTLFMGCYFMLSLQSGHWAYAHSVKLGTARKMDSSLCPDLNDSLAGQRPLRTLLLLQGYFKLCATSLCPLRLPLLLSCSFHTVFLLHAIKVDVQLLIRYLPPTHHLYMRSCLSSLCLLSVGPSIEL